MFGRIDLTMNPLGYMLLIKHRPMRKLKAEIFHLYLLGLWNVAFGLAVASAHRSWSTFPSPFLFALTKGKRSRMDNLSNGSSPQKIQPNAFYLKDRETEYYYCGYATLDAMEVGGLAFTRYVEDAYAIKLEHLAEVFKTCPKSFLERLDYEITFIDKKLSNGHYFAEYLIGDNYE